MKPSIIFFGSSEFSVPVLQKLLDTSINVVQVVTTPDVPVGRHLKLTPNPVKLLAQKNNLSVIDNWQLVTVNSDVIGLVAAYGKIIPTILLSKFNNQIYNIHPSLLPKYRGPSPLQQQILDGINETGVTLIQIDSQMDHGPIVAQKTDVLLPNDTPHSLGHRLFSKGTDLSISLVLSTSPLALTPQDDSLASYTKKLTRQDGFIPWTEFNNTLSTSPLALSTKFRAFSPWPGVWTINPNGKRIKLIALTPQVLVQEEGKNPTPWQL